MVMASRLITSVLFVISISGLFFKGPSVYAQSNRTSFGSPVSFSKGKSTRDTKGRFAIEIDRVAYGGSTYFKDLSVRLVWASSGGRALEQYSVMWQFVDEIPSNRTLKVSRSQLSKYPSLLRRFDRIKPTKLEIDIYGDASGEVGFARRGKTPLGPYRITGRFKKDGMDYQRYYLGARIRRSLNNNDITLATSGKYGPLRGTGGPANWNEFIDWWSAKNPTNSYDPIGSGLLLSRSAYSSMSVSKKLAWDKDLQNLFEDVTSLHLKGSVKSVEWPEAEFEAILAKFEEYEKNPKKEKDDAFWKNEGEEQTDDEDDTEKDYWTNEGTEWEEEALKRHTENPESNQFIGEIDSKTRSITIRYRDHGKQDGDRVSILNNRKTIASNLYLTTAFQSISVKLEFGMNRIDFKALNEGDSSPNTAEFEVYDETGKMISSKEWSITTGFTATLLIRKL
jgi:hypothetical protein